MGGPAKILPVALLCLAALAPWTGVRGQDGPGVSIGDGVALGPGVEIGSRLASGPAASPLAAPGPAPALGPGADRLDEEVVDNMEAELDEMVLSEAMGPTSSLAALAPGPSSIPRSVGPLDDPVVASPPSVTSQMPSAPADGDVAVADRILNKVRDGDNAGAADEIVKAVNSSRVDAVTAAAVLARDKGLSSEMAEALSEALLRGVRPSQVREAFAIVGSG